MAWTGCAGSQGPDVVTVPGDRYGEAFDTAVLVAREHGMRPAFMDRRAGIIETDPVIAGSVLEPWYSENADFKQAMRNTLSHNRIRARFEFTRAGFKPRTAGDEVPPIDVLGVTNEGWDLTSGDDPLDLKVWVFEERGHTVGQRRNSWTFAGNSRTYHVPVEGGWDANQRLFWTPTSRDRPAENRLLAEIMERMGLQGATANAALQQP